MVQYSGRIPEDLIKFALLSLYHCLELTSLSHLFPFETRVQGRISRRIEVYGTRWEYSMVVSFWYYGESQKEIENWGLCNQSKFTRTSCANVCQGSNWSTIFHVSTDQTIYYISTLSVSSARTKHLLAFLHTISVDCLLVYFDILDWFTIYNWFKFNWTQKLPIRLDFHQNDQCWWC